MIYNDKPINQQCLNRLQALDEEYQPWKKAYKDLRKLVVPFNGTFDDDADTFDPVSNDERYNSEVTRSARVFEAGMLSGLCSPSRPWFQTTLEDEDLASFRSVRAWLDYVEMLYYNGFARSNFYGTQKMCFGDKGVFGTAVLMPERLPRPPWVFFHHFVPGMYRLANSYYGRPDTIYRPIQMTVGQVIKAFGMDKLSVSTRNAYDNGNPYQKVDIIHAIEPRDKRDNGKIDSKNKKWRSVWFEKGESDKVLRESGYDVFQPVVSRFLQINNLIAYGGSPGLDVLKRIRMLNQMEIEGLKGLHREVEPPLVAPNRFEGVLDLRPNAVNWDSGSGEKMSVGPIMSVKIDWQKFQFRLDKIEQSVSRAFFTDLFLMVMQADDEGVSAQETATRVLKRHEEKMTVLSPVIENEITESFDPIFDRMFDIFMSIPGLIPPPPPEIQGREIKIKYVSPLAQAAKMAEVTKIHTFFDVVERISAFDPDIVMAIDGYKTAQEADEAIGVPVNVLRSEDEYKNMVQAKRQAEQQAQMMQGMEQMGGVAKNLGGASTGEGTALGDLKEALGG